MSNDDGKLRVLHVFKTYFPDTQGGLEETIRQVCFNTLSHGFEHRVFTLSPTADPAVVVRPEATVYRTKLIADIASCPVSLRALGRFRTHRNWADIIHYHFPWPFGDLLHLSGGASRPSLVSYQSDIVRQRSLMRYYRPLQDRFLRSVDRIVATSPNYAETSPILSAHRDRVVVIPNGLAQEHYPAPSEAVVTSLERRLGRDFFLFVGVLRYYKGLHVLLAAARDAPFRIVIAGAGPMEQDLRRQIEAERLTNVTLLGQVTDEQKIALIQLSRAIVFPSHLRSEAFGMTLVEGAMFGKPLISAEIGTGTSFVNQDGESGLVVSADDPVQLRHAMERLNADTGLARRLGEGALARYEALFTGSHLGASYAQLYQNIHNSPTMRTKPE